MLSTASVEIAVAGAAVNNWWQNAKQENMFFLRYY